MKYLLLWTPRAQASLARVWLAAADREAVTRAVAELDRALMRAPEHEGESRSGRNRIVFARPLSAYYRYDVDRRRVYVLDVTLTKES